MDVKVVDASALAAIIFREGKAAVAVQLIGDAAMIAPGLLLYEMTNIAVTKSRRQPDQRHNIANAFGEFLNFPIQYRDVEFDGAASLALAKGLSGYDAAYLWLAQDTGAELVTLDRQLAAAAKEA